MTLETPYYLISEQRLLKNLKVIEYIKRCSGAKSLLALKCFSTWSVFSLMKKYMDGTTSSSVYEARLGYEKFGKETHAYCVAYSKEDVKKVSSFADKIIFNSITQLEMFTPTVGDCSIGIRVNPLVSYSCFDLADPARKFSRLGVIDKKSLLKILPRQHLSKAFVDRVSSFENSNGFFSVFGVVKNIDSSAFGPSIVSLLLPRFYLLSFH